MAWAAVALLGGAGLALAARASRLTFPEGADFPYVPGHMFGRAEEMTQALGRLAMPNYNVALVFGLAGLNRRGVTRYAMDGFRGRAVWDAAFDLSDPATQRALLAVTTAIRREPCPELGPNATLVPRDGVGSAAVGVTVLEAFQAWAVKRNGSLPHGPPFSRLLQTWLAADGRAHRSALGFVGGRLRFVRLEFASALSIYSGSASLIAVAGRYEAFLRRELSFAPSVPGLRSGFPLVYMKQLNAKRGRPVVVDMAVINSTYERLAGVLRSNLIAALVVCAAVLAASVRSALLALYATLTVTLIVMAMLGTLQLAGWSLGLNHLVGATVVVGFSFDYTLHLCCFYRASPCPTRRACAADAVRGLRGALAGAAATTSVSMLVMLATDMMSLRTLAKMVSLAIWLSLLFSFGFFMPLCVLAGPPPAHRPQRPDADAEDSIHTCSASA